MSPHHYRYNISMPVGLGEFSDANLPLQREQPRHNLSGHTEGQLESSADHLEGHPVNLLPPHRL